MSVQDPEFGVVIMEIAEINAPGLSRKLTFTKINAAT